MLNSVFISTRREAKTGSIAFLARTPRGSVLLTGDACHTAWGWEHGVGPGTFSEDIPASAASLQRLKAFVSRHPKIDVRLGHQSLAHEPSAPVTRLTR